MKKVQCVLSVLLALALLLALCACGGKTDTTGKETDSAGGLSGSSIHEAMEQAKDTSVLSAYAGEYTFLCVRFSAAYVTAAFELEGVAQDIPDQYVDMPQMEGETVKLEADGTGYLYWGDENQGPIEWWTMDGDKLRFQAGVAVIDGTIENGIMTVKIDDGFWACFTLPGTDTSGIAPISIDDYFDRLNGNGTEEAAPETPAPAEETPAPETPTPAPETPTPAPETPAPSPETPAPAPVEGEYTIFAVQNDGYLVKAEELEADSTLSLAADGTGFMTMDSDRMEIASWKAEGETLTVTLADGSSAGAVLRGGVIELDIWGTGEMLFVYAREGADTSAYAPMTLDELMEAYAANMPDSRLYALWSGLDTEAGVHLRYDRHVDYMDSDQSFDVHGKGGVYYSRRTTRVSGFENTVITFFRDGTAYNLYPEDMTGLIATTTTSAAITNNIMRMDSLYADIWTHAQETEYSEETRELDGVSYTVEVFPATEYTPEAAFYFDNAGQLVYYIAGAPVAETAVELGESVYRIYAIDGAVDESLFDISGYSITE